MLAKTLLFVLILATSTDQALARCEGALFIGSLHDAYRATVLETGKSQMYGAQSLLVLASGQSGASLERSLATTEAEVSEGELSAILADARSEAERILGNDHSSGLAAKHVMNIESLGNLFLETGCRDVLSGTSRPAGDTVTPETATASFKIRLTQTAQRQLLSSALYAVAFIGFAAVIYRALTSFHVRKRRVERMPRTPILLPLEISCESPVGKMSRISVDALDISAGGLKVSWSDAPEPGTSISVDLMAKERPAQIAWSNTHYAGIIFRDMLSDRELKALTRTQKQKAAR